jgi:hypothetical protein
MMLYASRNTLSFLGWSFLLRFAFTRFEFASSAETTFAPATGIYRGGLAKYYPTVMLNEQAAQKCRIVMDGFSSASHGDSMGNVLFEGYRSDAFMALECPENAETALEIDENIMCYPINNASEGCIQGFTNPAAAKQEQHPFCKQCLSQSPG